MLTILAGFVLLRVIYTADGYQLNDEHRLSEVCYEEIKEDEFGSTYGGHSDKLDKIGSSRNCTVIWTRKLKTTQAFVCRSENRCGLGDRPNRIPIEHTMEECTRAGEGETLLKNSFYCQTFIYKNNVTVKYNGMGQYYYKGALFITSGSTVDAELKLKIYPIEEIGIVTGTNVFYKTYIANAVVNGDTDQLHLFIRKIELNKAAWLQYTDGLLIKDGDSQCMVLDQNSSHIRKRIEKLEMSLHLIEGINRGVKNECDQIHEGEIINDSGCIKHKEGTKIRNIIEANKQGTNKCTKLFVLNGTHALIPDDEDDIIQTPFFSEGTYRYIAVSETKRIDVTIREPSDDKRQKVILGVFLIALLLIMIITILIGAIVWYFKSRPEESTTLENQEPVKRRTTRSIGLI